MAKLVNDNEYNVNEYRKFSWEKWADDISGVKR